MSKYKILLIEDEGNIRQFTTALLEANHYQVIGAETLEEGFLFFSSYKPDLVILDLGLPDGEGLDFLTTIRTDSSAPVIVLSARAEEQEKVSALDAGANDYITKPFGSAELLARVRSVLRNNRHAAESGKLTGGTFTSGDMVIDYDARKFFIDKKEIKLTQTEFNLIALLSEHFGKVLTYATIIKEIWGYSDSGSVKKLQVNMANIRRKLSLKPGENKYIANELGVGYRMFGEE